MTDPVDAKSASTNLARGNNDPTDNAVPVDRHAPVGQTNQILYRQATPDDADMIHAILRPYVANHKLFARTEAEVVELTRHGFIAHVAGRPIGFAAVEVYSRKLAEVQCLAVRSEHQGQGVGKELVALCVQRARDLGVVEVMAISSSEEFLKQCGFDYALPDQKRALFYQLQPRHPEA